MILWMAIMYSVYYLHSQRILFLCYLGLIMDTAYALMVSHSEDHHFLENVISCIRQTEVTKQHRKLIHVVSTGCVGSSYTARQLEEEPIDNVFHEPFNTMFTGHYRKPMYQPLLDCLFLNHCDDGRLQYRLKRSSSREWGRSRSPMFFTNKPTQITGVKTVQFTRFDLVQELFNSHPDLVHEYVVILLTRDPRGTWNSCRRHEGWREADPHYLCDKFMDITTKLTALVQMYTDIPVMVMYYEYMVTLQPEEYQQILFRFADVPMNTKEIERENATKTMMGDKTDAMQYANRWINEMNLSEIQHIQEIPHCKEWIERFHFDIVNETNYEHFNHLSVEEMTSQMFNFPLH